MSIKPNITIENLTVEEKQRQTERALMALRYAQNSINTLSEDDQPDLDGLFFTLDTILTHLELLHPAL